MIEIHPLLPTQGPLLKQLRCRALAESPDAFITALQDMLALSDDEWAEVAAGYADNPRSTSFIAYYESLPCAMAGCMLTNPENTETELVAIWVDPFYRKLGVGVALVQYARNWSRAQGAGVMHAWVTEVNAGALGFYERLGFNDTGLRQPYPPNPEWNEVQLALAVPENGVG